MLTHKQAFDLVSASVKQILGDQPQSVAVFCCAIGCLESAYGSAWKAPGTGSHNWGAIQHRAPPCSPSIEPQPGKPGCFCYRDSTPQSDGTSKSYAVCFRAYASDIEGVDALVKTVYSSRRKSVLAAAQAGDIWAFSAALYDTVYYQGFGKTREVRISHHADAVRQHAAAIERAIGAKQEPGIRTLRRGMAGPDVADWQMALNEDGAGLKVDGVFGVLTETATRHWQHARGLVADGVVGAKTMAAAAG